MFSWKGKSTFAAVPGWSRPIDTSNVIGIPFKARPIKHWRKQLQPNNNTGNRSAFTIPFDKPGSYVYLENNCNCATDNSGGLSILTHIPQSKNINFYPESTEKVTGPNNSTICISCDPETNRIRSGLTEKLINSQDKNTAPTTKYNFSTKSYLQSRCKTYQQRLSGRKDPNITYIIPGTQTPVPPSNNNTGSQVRLSLYCPLETCNGNAIKIINKPNNIQYYQQGAVSSSSRLDRLKLNTINKNGGSFQSAWGAAAANAGKYRGSSNAPYFIKSKNNICYNGCYK